MKYNYDVPHFVFNGVKSTELGIVIKSMPPISKAQKDIESISVVGRNGNLHIDNKSFRSKRYTVVCILMDEEKIDDLKRILEGTGILELSSEPNREYSATIMNQIDFSKYLNYLKEFSITFEVYPIAYSKDENTLNFTNSNNTFSIDGTYNVNPKITITGVGQISLNNVALEVSETGITIDCELMNCTKSGLNKNNKVTLSEFPHLIAGDNNLTLGEGITSVSITYKEGWL